LLLFHESLLLKLELPAEFFFSSANFSLESLLSEFLFIVRVSDEAIEVGESYLMVTLGFIVHLGEGGV